MQRKWFRALSSALSGGWSVEEKSERNCGGTEFPKFKEEGEYGHLLHRGAEYEA